MSCEGSETFRRNVGGRRVERDKEGGVRGSVAGRVCVFEARRKTETSNETQKILKCICRSVPHRRVGSGKVCRIKALSRTTMYTVPHRQGK